MVEQAIAESMRALVDRDNEVARMVITRDQEVNELHRQLRERAFMIMATQQPVARDLRLIVSFQHMVLELERMGDHAVGIARAALRLNDLPLLNAVHRSAEDGRTDQVPGARHPRRGYRGRPGQGAEPSPSVTTRSTSSITSSGMSWSGT